ncbi:hypothetical protein [Chitinophaga filiformis]|uniref:Uncharacterized protein n=1 Tax=Chitinophaga filiformis TaxID=104663 RepID=A0ABY4I4J7_CHIFI|nr:hypothetical protein [Chitinophaga filiformis]UPK70299.1 hypothetical protein MYF79_03205 [Chitinophaga filiformis]
MASSCGHMRNTFQSVCRWKSRVIDVGRAADGSETVNKFEMQKDTRFVLMDYDDWDGCYEEK